MLDYGALVCVSVEIGEISCSKTGDRIVFTSGEVFANIITTVAGVDGVHVSHAGSVTDPPKFSIP
jgi:hypothetical protein